MASFRSAKAQAQHAIDKLSAIGQARHGNQKDSKIHSIGTARNYRQCLKLFGEWLHDQRRGNIKNATREVALMYLNDVRSLEVRQKQLNQDRQALQALIGERLPMVKSELQTVVNSRAYTQSQLQFVIAAQAERNALSTRIAAAAGLRAHELLTLRHLADRPASQHREWHQQRFAGREGVIYTVCGKGGLIREVLIPSELAERLEALRLETPVTVSDRGILYQQQHYNLSGGKAWSQSFSAASQRALGWSQGAHGCRHTYVQQRIDELGALGFRYDDAKTIVANEIGHFRNEEKLIGVYLR